jgi:amino acid adenylation domain-containing protein
MYGITETTVHVTYRRIRLADLEAGRGSLIGCPISDLQVYVLDDHLNPVPVGVSGEIYVGGAGLSRGYLNRPALTAGRFIPHPFSDKPGARLYRTGDHARLLPDGDLEYLGRADQQVKIRGFRIELGEIEATLARHSAIRQVIVLAREDDAGEKRLAAYVVCDKESAPKTSGLREFLKEKLPEHMLPAAIVKIDSLPLTSNGKVDRAALPPPDWSRLEIESDFIVPRTSVEQALADVWVEVLGASQVGIDDNYFALGGDSIRSIQIRAKALEKGFDVSLQQLFQHQTIRELAEQISVTQANSATTDHEQPFNLISEEDRRRLPRDVEDAYPLSRLQAGMVFHSEYSPDYIIYVSSFHLHLPLDIEKLRTALDQMASRHEMLRTSFDLTSFSQPLQLVHRTTHLPLHVEDLRHLSPIEQQERIDEWIETETRKAFDWTSAPLLRFQVHLRGPDSVQFAMSEPFFDGWSVASFCTELFERYFALVNEKAIPVEPLLSASYRDFVVLEREALESEQCRSYWAAALADSTASLVAHRSFDRRSANKKEVVRLEVPISMEVSDGLKRLARGKAVSLKSVLLAAHMKVVGLFSGQSDVIGGLLINGRPEKTDGDQVLGAFLNTVPLRLKLQSGTWADLVRQAFEAEHELLPFRRYPIQELQRVHGAERLFDTVFNYTHFHVADRLRNVAGLEVLDVDGSEQTYYALTAQFNVNNLSSRIELALDYRTLELGAEQVEEIAGYYSRVLAAMATEPSARHESLCLLSDRERERLLVELNDTRAHFSEDRCVHQLFEDRAEEFHDATAVVFNEEKLSYRELNRRANKVAHHLRKLGVGPETLVGICVERSLEMLTGLLGILKAGGAYVPLNPEYPKERLAFMMTDAQVKVVLTQEQLVQRLPEDAAQVVCLDSDWPKISEESDENLSAKMTPDNLAYLIYTSGSTGQPKGVLITHRGVTNVIEASIEKFDVTSRSRILQAASLSFDASVLEIFMALVAGAQLYLVSRDTLMSGDELAHALREQEITMAALTPSLLDLLPIGEYPALHSMTVGGEACSAATAARWSGGRRFFNVYAPTEATIYATAMQCAEGLRQSPPLGRPISNMQVYLLDSYLQPVPVSVPGEIHIGGVGLARGYLNLPSLTAERFIPDPFGHTPGTRLYKTGDMARYLPDGNIEFTGRNDFQVKIRGFRIELGEIESVLGGHPSVREAVIVARGNAPGEKRLVAYVVAHEGLQPSTSELRHYLKKRLPEYMLPASFVMLDAFPLTATGKIDRNALPAPEQMRPEPAQNYVAPQTAVEEVLTGIFAEVLGVERVGIHDDFFEAGGHSLLATRVVSRVREAFEVELPLRKIFDEPTVGGLARVVLEDEDERMRVERTAELLLRFSDLSDDEVSDLLVAEFLKKEQER